MTSIAIASVTTGCSTRLTKHGSSYSSRTSEAGRTRIGPDKESARPQHIDGPRLMPGQHRQIRNRRPGDRDLQPGHGADRGGSAGVGAPTGALRGPLPQRDPSDWGDPRRHGYAMGKLIAERSFAQAAARSGRWEAIACLPSDNVGPIQSADQKAMGPWQSQVAMMLQGKYPQKRSYRPWMPVEVRDNAECHIASAMRPLLIYSSISSVSLPRCWPPILWMNNTWSTGYRPQLRSSSSSASTSAG